MLERITEKQAEKLYQTGKQFVMVPSKMRPDSFMARHITKTSFESLVDEPFENMVNMFRYYNCNAETGRRVAFYR